MHRAVTRLVVMALACSAAAAAEPSLAVRFYPSKALRPHEIDARRGLSGLLLQNAAVVNGGPGAVTLDRMEIDLVAGGSAVQTQRLGAVDLERAAKKGSALQQAGLIEKYAFQFRPDLLLGKGILLSPGPRLEPGSALLVGHRFFVIAGGADALRVRAFGRREDGAEVEAEGTLPIDATRSKVAYGFPLSGRWFIGAGQALHHHHRWVVPEEFALDIVRLGGSGATHGGDGTNLADYHAFGVEVLAAADGVVVSTEGSIGDSEPMPRRPGEPGDQYERRIMTMQETMLAAGFLRAAGNHVVIEHPGGEYSFYGHLAAGSLRVRKGETVRRGQPIARLGNSGNTTEPHLHFHVTDGPDPLMSAGLPVRFDNVTLPLADFERALQSGDIVETP